MHNYKTIQLGVAFSVQGAGSKQTVNSCMGKKNIEFNSVLITSLHNSNNSDLLVTMNQAKGIPSGQYEEHIWYLPTLSKLVS